MRIALAQLNFHIGNFEYNLKKMLSAVETAKEQKADIICFSELTTCGYPPRDFLEFDDFINQANHCVAELAKAANGIAIIVGSPSKNPSPLGKNLFNSAFFLADQKIQQIANKALLPTYDIFDEYRYFEPAKAFNIVNYKGKKIALTICEDIWDLPTDGASMEDYDPLYTVRPMDELYKQKPDFAINISASPFSYIHPDSRVKIVKANVARYKIPMFYINHVGAQTELIFDGGSMVVSGNGNVHAKLPHYEEAIQTFDLDEVMEGKKNLQIEHDKMEMIHNALVLGVKDYFGKLGFKKALIGLSGGIDSALTTYIAAKALGSENVRVVLMPSQYSSDHSVNDARDLAENLGLEYDIIEIKPAFDTYQKMLAPYFKDLPENVAEENLQARSRGMILMAMSNKFGHIVLNTTNKSEMAVGYGTLYGDMCGGISVIGDVYKTEVFELCRWINKDKEIIPTNTITKPPSAELRPDQKDSDSLPEYDILDEILFQYIENRQGPQEIIAMGFDEKLVKRVLRLVNISEFKRHQTAPVLRMSSKAFGMGRRMPIVGKYLS